MSASAIFMMLLAMLVIWGGLVTAIINLRRSPDTAHADDMHRDL